MYIFEVSLKLVLIYTTQNNICIRYKYVPIFNWWEKVKLLYIESNPFYLLTRTYKCGGSVFGTYVAGEAK